MQYLLDSRVSLITTNKKKNEEKNDKIPPRKAADSALLKNGVNMNERIC